MAFGVFMHKPDSIYGDVPPVRYQFPKQYLTRAEPSVGDWILYLEPTKLRNSRGYFAAAKVEKIVPDPTAPEMYLALIEEGSYLDFPNPVPFNGPNGVVESGVLNDKGRNSGRAQAAVRPISASDFNRIVTLGLEDASSLLPRIDEPLADGTFQESRTPFVFEQERDRASFVSNRLIRNRAFRRVVLRAYDERCAITGLKLINGGGRAEVEAAHIRPVERNGPDSLSNGIALSGTAHWMFDRGLISLSDDLEILVSRQVNDPDGIHAIINKGGHAMLPIHGADRPHPHFLQWHRDNCFKH